MGLSCDQSIRGACYANEVPRSSLRALNGVFTGTARFVNSVTGSDGYDGLSADRPYATIAAAVADASAGDTIYLKGTFNEAVTCSLAGLRFIGTGTVPRETSWTAPTVAGSFCLKLAAAYCEVANIYFKPVIYTSSGIPSGIYLSGANWSFIHDCRFQGQTGSYKAIYSPVCDSDNVRIQDCEFMYMNTATHGAGIYGVEAGGLSYSGWNIERCKFNSCITGIDLNMRCGTIKDCEFDYVGIDASGATGNIQTVGLDVSGTSSTGNCITGNRFGGTYAVARYVPSAGGDNWMGNYAAITVTTAPNGLTVLAPAS